MASSFVDIRGSARGCNNTDGQKSDSEIRHSRQKEWNVIQKLIIYTGNAKVVKLKWEQTSCLNYGCRVHNEQMCVVMLACQKFCQLG
jgi:hypothetical protein